MRKEHIEHLKFRRLVVHKYKKRLDNILPRFHRLLLQGLVHK